MACSPSSRHCSSLGLTADRGMASPVLSPSPWHSFQGASLQEAFWGAYPTASCKRRCFSCMSGADLAIISELLGTFPSGRAGALRSPQPAASPTPWFGKVGAEWLRLCLRARDKGAEVPFKAICRFLVGSRFGHVFWGCVCFLALLGGTSFRTSTAILLL